MQQLILHEKRHRIETMEYGVDGVWKLAEWLDSEKALIIIMVVGAVYFFNFLFCYYICIGFIFDQYRTSDNLKK